MLQNFYRIQHAQPADPASSGPSRNKEGSRPRHPAFPLPRPRPLRSRVRPANGLACPRLSRPVSSKLDFQPVVAGSVGFAALHSNET